jgi:hypothetical protein
MVEEGLRSLEWLLKTQTNEQGNISLIGCNGWYKRGGEKALFDQQPIEIMSLVAACVEAYRMTGDQRWGAEIQRCLGWFLGKNDLNTPLYDFKTGGCRDGLNPQGANQNEGAESTLSWLISVIAVHDLLGVQEIGHPIPDAGGLEGSEDRTGVPPGGAAAKPGKKDQASRSQ